MQTILIQILLIALLSIVIKDLIQLKRYKWWNIPIFLYATYCEYSAFYNLIGSLKEHFLIFLTGIILIQLGAIFFLLVKNFRYIER